jgi:hypothetical protein
MTDNDDGSIISDNDNNLGGKPKSVGEQDLISSTRKVTTR